jgi:hypothetical protein
MERSERGEYKIYINREAMGDLIAGHAEQAHPLRLRRAWKGKKGQGMMRMGSSTSLRQKAEARNPLGFHLPHRSSEKRLGGEGRPALFSGVVIHDDNPFRADHRRRHRIIVEVYVVLAFL